MAEKYGTLYVCATPIGNMGDITLRALETLKSVDFIAAEDTRRTLKLLNRYEIKKPIISCHEHNEYAKREEIAAALMEGKSAALVTDAGMPCISDPGGRIVACCVEKGLPVTVCPGASAAVSALVLSGFNCGRFVFEGFLPRKAKERRERLAELAAESRAVVLYEAPHRLLRTLKELYEHMGEREIAVAREMTKIHEEVVRATVSEAIRIFEEKGVRGELVIVVKGAEKTAAEASAPQEISVSQRVRGFMEGGLAETEAIKKTARALGVSKSAVYKEFKCKT